MKRTLGIVILGLLAVLPAVAAEEPPGVYVILDGSGSMWGQLPNGTHKITAAKEVLSGFTAADYDGRALAFRVYGHRRKGDCADSELVVPFSAPEDAIARMAAFAKDVNPKGKTPISRSLRAALADFGERPGEIILVSDGIETCDEDPCALVREWREKNVDIRVHVVGLGLGEKERAAMSCISEAAGTEYRDAQSAEELAAGLSTIREASGEPKLIIRGVDAAGESLRIEGTVAAAGAETLTVSSEGRNPVPPGTWTLEAGVRTRNGNLYRPVTRSVEVAEAGETVVELTVAEPPSVRARFRDAGEDTEGALVRGYQDGREVLRFRWFDRAYIDEGRYEFRTEPNAENKLVVTERFVAGEHKEIVFEMVHTVEAKIRLVASGTGTQFPDNYELWQDGEKVYKVHRINGVRALPGTYDVRLPNAMTPFVYPDLVITAEDQQTFRIEVPVGHVTFTYQKADGSPDKDDRVFLTRVGAGSGGRGRYTRGGTPIPLTAGSYFVEGWKNKGQYPKVAFEVTEGEDQAIVLRATDE